jgi:epoxyqueuosine reductase QueG
MDLKQLIIDYIKSYQECRNIKPGWKVPEVAFADTNDSLFIDLKKIVSPSHALPLDLLKNARTVVCFFIPFERSVARSNINGYYASRKWAYAYYETNELIRCLNFYIQKELEKAGFHSSIIPATQNFKETTLISDWSHRHVSYIGGLGTFGINNMLITKQGSCGRIGSIVTDLEIQPTKRPQREYCLNKIDSTKCKICINRCVTRALTLNDFDRFKCYKLLQENDRKHFEDEITNVCGKCLVGLPCSYFAPGG